VADFHPLISSPKIRARPLKKCWTDATDLIHNSEMSKRRNLTAAIFVPVLIGSMGLFHLMSQPRFADIRTVDVVQLTGSGMCFGVALTALFVLLRSKRVD
jgi:hypothetical protein